MHCRVINRQYEDYSKHSCSHVKLDPLKQLQFVTLDSPRIIFYANVCSLSVRTIYLEDNPDFLEIIFI